MSQPLTVSELSARSPDMDASEFAELVADIRANGQLVPIVVRNGEVIDGRKRLAACRQLGIEPSTVTLGEAQDVEAVARALNLLRTHYTTSQRAMFAAGRANATASDGARIRDRTPVEFHQGPISQRQAAKEVGVHHTAVRDAKKIDREAAPEVADAVRSGKLTLHAAKQIARIVPKDEQPQAVAKVVEASRGKAHNTPVAKVLNQTDRRRDRAAPKPSHEQFARAVQSMDVLADVLAANVEAANGDARRRTFLETLSHIRTTLTRVVRAMEIAA